MAWTAPKIKVMLQHVAAPQTAKPLAFKVSNAPARQPSPRGAAAAESSGYGRR